MKKLSLVFAIFLSVSSFGQSTDTVKVLAYNLLNFPLVNSSRISDIKIILQEVLPDILMVCEITSASGATGILDNALNQNGITYYAKANFVGGPDTENMLFFNSNKIGLSEQNEISTVLRDINEYVLYYKSSDLATTMDTTFFYVYVCHLKASQGNEAQRDSEIQTAKDYMATRPGIENILLGGDFNLYGSSEPAWSTIMSGAGVLMVDPVNTPGEWNNDFGYSNVHTQSTRTTSVGGGAIGGMDDRFDFIFMSPDLQNWGNQAKMVDNSYWAYGQDGNHFNDAITDAPTNSSVPAPVLQALYDMSDHLPVYMEIEVQKSFNGINEVEMGIHAFYNQDKDQIQFTFDDFPLKTGEISIFDLSGKEVMNVIDLADNGLINVSYLEHGLYILKEKNYGFTMKFVR
jgi:hypothetical protein